MSETRKRLYIDDLLQEHNLSNTPDVNKRQCTDQAQSSTASSSSTTSVSSSSISSAFSASRTNIANSHPLRYSNEGILLRNSNDRLLHDLFSTPDANQSPNSSSYGGLLPWSPLIAPSSPMRDTVSNTQLPAPSISTMGSVSTSSTLPRTPDADGIVLTLKKLKLASADIFNERKATLVKRQEERKKVCTSEHNETIHFEQENHWKKFHTVKDSLHQVLKDFKVVLSERLKTNKMTREAYDNRVKSEEEKTAKKVHKLLNRTNKQFTKLQNNVNEVYEKKIEAIELETKKIILEEEKSLCVIHQKIETLAKFFSQKESDIVESKVASGTEISCTFFSSSVKDDIDIFLAEKRIKLTQLKENFGREHEEIKARQQLSAALNANLNALITQIDAKRMGDIEPVLAEIEKELETFNRISKKATKLNNRIETFATPSL